MKLVANGCSFTEGHKDKFNNQPPNWVWPSLFKSTEEFSSVVNLATEGGSNDRLVRTTLEYFSNNTSEDTILVLQHPTPNRKEWYNTQHHMWIGYVSTEDDTLIDLSSGNFTVDNMEMLQTDTATQRKLVHQNKLLVEFTN